MIDPRIVIVGAGIGGLCCAIDLARSGFAVTVVEKASASGGKMREVDVQGARIDCGPTVLTMRWVFDELFSDAGLAFDEQVELRPLDILARHAWSANEQLDLFSDLHHSREAVAHFAGAAEGRRFLEFCAEARTMFLTLKNTFLAAPRPNPFTLSSRIGLQRPAALFAIKPFETMASALAKHFHDPRLRQLFGRYATYSGSSPFLAPATLMLIAHVEQMGVWRVTGGMQRIAEALQRLAHSLGVRFRFCERVDEIIIQGGLATGVTLQSDERLEADAVIINGDANAVAAGLFGTPARLAVNRLDDADRSLSAVTWAMTAESRGFDLAHHNVFFSRDYAKEFNEIFQQKRIPSAPTVYICAQDRHGDSAPSRTERLFMLVNAPAVGDAKDFTNEEIAKCEDRVFPMLEQCGLRISRTKVVTTTPTDFHRLFPGTGGALYGRASHGWMASFRRPASQTRIARLYLAGGTTHPGAGVPMAALSGRLAAQQIISDLGSMRSFHQVATFGGMSMPSALTAETR